MSKQLIAACVVLGLGSGCSYGVGALSKGPCSRQPAYADTGFAIGAGLMTAGLAVLALALSDDHGDNPIKAGLSGASWATALSTAVLTAAFIASASYGYEHDSCAP